jgi:hypothetical protein
MRLHISIRISADISSRGWPERWTLTLADTTGLGPWLSRLNESCHPARVTVSSWLHDVHGIDWRDDPTQEFGRRARARFATAFPGEPAMVGQAWQWISRRSGLRKVATYPAGFGALVFAVEWKASIAPLPELAGVAMAAPHGVRPTEADRHRGLAVKELA